MTFTQRLGALRGRHHAIGTRAGPLLFWQPFLHAIGCPMRRSDNSWREPGLMGDERTRCLMRCGAVTMADLRGLAGRGATSATARATCGTSRASGKFYRIEADDRPRCGIRGDGHDDGGARPAMALPSCACGVRLSLMKRSEQGGGRNHCRGFPAACNFLAYELELPRGLSADGGVFPRRGG